MPFGLEMETFTGFAPSQFQRRRGRARGASLAEIERAAARSIGDEADSS